MEKKMFNTDFSEMAELDDSLDINQILSNPPADIEKDSKKDVDDDTQEKSKKPADNKKEPIELAGNINDILAGMGVDKTSEEDDEFDDEEDDEVEQDDFTDNDELEDGAPANKTKDSSSPNTPFTVIFARDLEKRGLLSSFNEEEFTKEVEENGEAEALRSLIKKEVDFNVDIVRKDLDAGYQKFLELTGKGVEVESAATLVELQDRYDKIKVEDLEKDDNEDLRKSVMTEYYRLTSSMPEDKIKKLVDRSVDLGDDVEEAKEFLDIIKKAVSDQIKYEETQAQEQTKLAQEENERRLNELKQGIDALNEIIPGQRINKQTKDKIYDNIVKPVKDKSGQVTNALWAKRLEDPMFFDTRLAYLLETGFFEKGKTWDKIKQVKVSKEASELEDFLSKNKNTQSRTGNIQHISLKDKKLKDIIKDTGSIL